MAPALVPVGSGDEQEEIDLYAPFEQDVILEVRSSKMKTMPGLTIMSGIDKTIRKGTVAVGPMGLEDDEHDPTFHGGIDKAVHGYCSSHYPKWQAEYPEAASRFVPGGFGENLVTARMNERNVCIGDTVSIGDPDTGLLLQVSLPRQPCFKLNHRFKLKNFAPQTYTLSRTGWYYRVKRPGPVAAGMTIRLVDRPHPQWTIERIQEYLHRTLDNHTANEELAGIEVLGAESRGDFQNRVAKRRRAEEKRTRQGSEEEEAKDVWKDYRIVEKKRETDRVASFVFEAVPPLLPDAEPERPCYGCHARLKLPNGLQRNYSIVSGTPSRFELGVALEEPSRGGSAWLHREAQAGADSGSIVQVGRITPGIKPAGSSSNHVFIAGGIGITAFLPVIEVYKRMHLNSTLHLAVRSADEIPFRERILALGGGSARSGEVENGATGGHVEDGEDKKDDGSGPTGSSINVTIYDRSRGQRVDLPGIFAGLGWNSHVYVCGPPRMMDEALRESRAKGLADDEVHFEAFAADTGGDPFEVEVLNRTLASTGSGRSDGDGDGGGDGDTADRGQELQQQQKQHPILQVGEEETLLEVLRRNFNDVPSSCEVGNCGICRVTLRSGTVLHRGTALMDDEKQDGMLSCVSRGVGRIAIEI
ncbi:MOSC domain-containing protein [Xylariales sp. PMI_506]|nr:MOSC domain-containing protein [Xylariales sp. PMI_506]